MALTVTVMRKNIDEDDKCLFYVDDYNDPKEKFVLTANPLTFSRRALFTNCKGEQTFSIPFEDAKAMAREILKLGEDNAKA